MHNKDKDVYMYNVCLMLMCVCRENKVHVLALIDVTGTGSLYLTVPQGAPGYPPTL